MVRALVSHALDWEDGKPTGAILSIDVDQFPVILYAFARVTARALVGRESPATSLADIIDQLNKETQ